MRRKKNIANVEPRYQMQKYLCVSTGDNYNSLLILPLEYVVNAKHCIESIHVLLRFFLGNFVNLYTIFKNK